jgi:hypothetical protein
MSRVFSVVFCFVVCYLVVYNVLVMFPSIRHDPTSRALLKYGTIFVTVVIAKLVFKTQPKVAATNDDLTVDKLSDLDQWSKRPGY